MLGQKCVDTSVSIFQTECQEEYYCLSIKFFYIIVGRGFLTSLFYEDSPVLPALPFSNFVQFPPPPHPKPQPSLLILLPCFFG